MRVRWMLAACVFVFGTTGVSYAQSALGNASGPGQAVDQPAPQCPQALACQYAEQNLIPTGHRVQALSAGEPVVTPADQFPGFDATRQELTSEGWIVTNV